MIFDPYQLKAIQHTTGPMEVIAGPGSGKTAVVTWRIRNLIEQHSIDPASILTMTFSRAAAREMAVRFHEIFPGCKGSPMFGTFHSIFFTLLKRHSTKPIRILTEREKYQYLQTELKQDSDSIQEEDPQIHNLLNEISAAKNSFLPANEHAPKTISIDEFLHGYNIYQKILQVQQAMDFDDILTRTLLLLEENPALLRQLQEQYSFFQVDEFQDVNPVQYEILSRLTAPCNNLFVVGDDDQSIYGFRGAAPAIMQQFSKDFPNSDHVYLTNNYRCPKIVLDPALHLINRNTLRFEKEILSCRQDPLATYTVTAYETLQEQYQQISKWLREKHETFGIPWAQMSILLRRKRNTGLLGRILSHEKIPLQGLVSVQTLKSHFIYQDLCAYLKAAIGQATSQDILRTIEHPYRYISRFAVPEQKNENTASLLEKMRSYDRTNPSLQHQIQLLEDQLHRMRTLAPFAACVYLFKGCGYESFLEEQAKNHAGELKDNLLVFQQLTNLAKEYDSLYLFLKALSTMDSSALKASESIQQTDGIQILTLHGSKGLEFPVVCIPDLNQGILPSGKADFEEERRLLYVGMTRSSCHLHLSYVKEMNEKEVFPSQFLKDMD